MVQEMDWGHPDQGLATPLQDSHTSHRMLQ